MQNQQHPDVDRTDKEDRAQPILKRNPPQKVAPRKQKPAGVDLSEESVAGEEDPGASLDLVDMPQARGTT
ncbi:MAG TPA: hypothetical protein VE934_09325 [Polaromonas sp.]|nr:hypothetical protein [Polaromonas sp.]